MPESFTATPFANIFIDEDKDEDLFPRDFIYGLEAPSNYVGAAKVFGTVLLSVLSGHWRYAHINAERGDGVNPGLLGIDGTVSEDVVR